MEQDANEHHLTVSADGSINDVRKNGLWLVGLIF